jgi:hypothetical protein
MLSQRATHWGKSFSLPRLRRYKPYVFALMLAAGCGGAGDSAAEGEECFRAADCEEGLVCIAGKCSRDLSGIISQVEGPAGGQDASAAGGAAGAAGVGGDAGASEAGATGGAAGDGGASGAATGGNAGNGGNSGSGTAGDTSDASGGD